MFVEAWNAATLAQGTCKDRAASHAAVVTAVLTRYPVSWQQDTGCREVTDCYVQRLRIGPRGRRAAALQVWVQRRGVLKQLARLLHALEPAEGGAQRSLASEERVDLLQPPSHRVADPICCISNRKG